MTRKFLYGILVCFMIFFSAIKADAKSYNITVNGKENKVDLKGEDELKSYFKKNFPDYRITKIDDKTGVVSTEVLIEINLIDGETKKTVKVPNKNVGAIMKYLGIKLGKDDFVLPAEDQEPQDGKITVFRTVEKIVETLKEKPFEVLEQDSTDPAQKEDVVLREGVNGLNKVFKKERYVNGVLKSSIVVKEEVQKEPIDKIVKVPMKGIEAITRSASRGYVMNATAYEAGPLSTGKRPGQRGYGITASGTRARRGTVAVDRRVIPLGTKLYVKSLDPNYPDYGYAIAEDTGGAIKGMRIDLFMNTVWECFQFGRRKVKVFILPASTPDSLFR